MTVTQKKAYAALCEADDWVPAHYIGYQERVLNKLVELGKAESEIIIGLGRAHMSYRAI